MSKAPAKSKTRSRARLKPRRVSSPAKAPVAAAESAAESKDDGRAPDAIPEFVGTGAIADFLDYSTRRISQMVKAGIIQKEARGNFRLKDVVAAIITYTRDLEAKKANETSGDRLKEVRRLEVERSMARDDRKIIAIDESVDAIDSVVGLFVESLESIPGRMTRDQTERARLQAVCDEIRGELATRLSEEGRALRTGERPSSSIRAS